MKKKDLISKLRKHLAIGEFKWKGQEVFAAFLLEYLQNLSIPADEKYDFWNLNHHIPQLLVDAFEELRIGTSEYALRYRKEYEQDTEHPVPEILNINGGNIYNRQSAIQTTLGFLMRDLIDDMHICHAIESYCYAQDHLLQTTFDKFLRHVYRGGMFDLIDKCELKGMNGKFGSVKVLTFSMCGRTQIQFDHADGEQSVAFMMEEDDPLAYSAGIHSVHTDVHTGCAMIEEVIKNWPAESELQQQMFAANGKVTLDIIAAMQQTA